MYAASKVAANSGLSPGKAPEQCSAKHAPECQRDKNTAMMFIFLAEIAVALHLSSEIIFSTYSHIHHIRPNYTAKA